MIRKIDVRRLAESLAGEWVVRGVLYTTERIVVSCDRGRINRVLLATGLELSQDLDRDTVSYETYLEDGTSFVVTTDPKEDPLYKQWLKNNRGIAALGEWAEEV